MFAHEAESARKLAVVKFQRLPDGRYTPDTLADRNCLRLHCPAYKPTRDWDDLLRQLSVTPLWARHPSMPD